MQIIRTWARRSVFVRHNLIFFFGSVAVGFLNYLYYPVMGRLLGPQAFGEVQTLISLFLQITIFLSVLGLVTINVVANYSSSAKRNAVVLEFERLAFAVSLVLLLTVVVFQGQLQQFLHFEAGLPFVLLTVALVASVPFTFRGAYLRGRQSFGLASGVNILGAGSKLLFSVLLVLAGLGTAGAIGGLIAAQVLASGVAVWWALKQGLAQPSDDRLWRLPSRRILAPEIRYGLLVLAGSLVVALQYSVDVIVVKHYFDPHTAGLYAGIAGVARILFFLTASCAMVMMPMVKMSAPPAANRRLLLKTLLLVGVVGLPVLGLFLIAPAFVTGLLMGGEYRPMAPLLPLLGTTIFIISLINVIILYFLALRKFTVAPVIGVGAAATYVLLITQHGTPRAVVMSLFTGSLIMLFVLIIWAANARLRRFYLRETRFDHYSNP